VVVQVGEAASEVGGVGTAVVVATTRVLQRKSSVGRSLPRLGKTVKG